MDGLGRAFYFLLDEADDVEDWRTVDEWRKLHRRPDALPLPAEPPRPSLRARIAAIIPVVRNLGVRRS